MRNKVIGERLCAKLGRVLAISVHKDEGLSRQLGLCEG